MQYESIFQVYGVMNVLDHKMICPMTVLRKNAIMEFASKGNERIFCHIFKIN